MSEKTSKVFASAQKNDTEAIFISSRIRLARNLRGELFSTVNSLEDKSRVFQMCKKATSKLRRFSESEFLNLNELPSEAIEYLVESNMISRELASSEGDRGAFISNDSSACIMVNEEDHLRLQVKERGLCLASLWKKINSIDSTLEKHLDYAFDRNFGYLTTCPTNAGTGMRASVMMHLPALYLQGGIEKISRGLNQLGIVVRGSGGESSEPVGAFYQISNQRTLGVAEEAIVKTITEICVKLAEFEENARLKLLEDSPEELFDKISRAWGVLMSCRMISSGEAIECLSFLRLAADMGFMAAKSKVVIDSMILEMRPAHLEKGVGKIAMTPYERDVLRSQLIKSALSDVKAPSFPKSKKQLKKSK